MGGVATPSLTAADGEITSIKRGDTITFDNVSHCMFILRQTSCGNKVKLNGDDKMYFGEEPISGGIMHAFVRLIAANSHLGFKCSRYQADGLSSFEFC